MIRYQVSRKDLERCIETKSPGWLDEARRKTLAFRGARKYGEKSGTWGKIKSVYMELQHNKCAFCEQKLEGLPYGSILHAVEHFRPKNTVKVWPTSKIRKERRITWTFSTGALHPGGYYLLAYNIFNYTTACHVCNTTLKGSYFPVEGPRGPLSPVLEDYKRERPLLLYPLGTVDPHDPEELIEFQGVLPKPRFRNGFRHRRATVTIDFFDLTGIWREQLLRERARLLEELYSALEKEDKNKVERLCSPASEHTNCARCFRKLYRKNPGEATELAEAASRYLNSQSR